MAAAKPLVVVITFLLTAVAAIPSSNGGGDLPPYPLLQAEPPTLLPADPAAILPPADPAATGCRGSVGMCPSPPSLGTAAGASTMSADNEERVPGLGKAAGASTMSADDEERPVRRRVHHQQRDSVPCSRRGASYYNCRPGESPYRRSCFRIKNCRG